MSLRERLHAATGENRDARTALFRQYGVRRNPFPVAGEPAGHPHLEVAAEERIVDSIRVFDRDHSSQVLLVQGTQGVGKTNLLNYFQSELEALYEGGKGYYIIRYYPDPESTFDGILRRLFQEFHQSSLLLRLGQEVYRLKGEDRARVLALAHSQEIRLMLSRLAEAASGADSQLESAAELAFEWLSGLRLLNKHRDALSVHFRLDSIESKTQALRDLVFCSSDLGLLSGILLLLDELEKQDYSLSKTVVLRYLSAVRALIDALPRSLFMLVALTPAARNRYFSMLPAFAGRLQNVVELKPLTNSEEALSLYHFYVEMARRHAAEEAEEAETGWGAPGKTVFLSDNEVVSLYQNLLRKAAAEKAQEGVTQRDFLNAVHLAVEGKLKASIGR